MYKFTKKDLLRKCDPESHTDGGVVDMVVEVLFGLVDGPIGEEFMVGKDSIAVASFDGDRCVVVFLGVGDKSG